ncbi:MAG: CheR family methyltransferase [Desulfurivibrionaceae bacterium]
MARITPDEISLFADYIFDISGIHIGKDKGYLLETRLGPLLDLTGSRSFTELYYKTKNQPSGDLEKTLIDAISTNETFFFRDNTPFELMKNKIIPDLIDRRSRQFPNGPIPLRIWSAACSTGQEVYSIAITLLEMLTNLNRYDISILGTDISNKALAQASYGQYNPFEVGRGMPENLLKKYFHKTGSSYRINDNVRVLAKFKQLNLMEDFGHIGRFDVIFCRNVAIYFNQANKIGLFKKLAHNLAPDGALIVGGSETLRGYSHDFEDKQYLKGIFYQLKGEEKEQAARDIKEPSTRAAKSGSPVHPSAEPKKKKTAPKARPQARKKTAKTKTDSAAAEKQPESPPNRKVKPDRPTPVQEKTEKPESIKRSKMLSDSIKNGRNSGKKPSLLATRVMKKSSGNSLLAEGKNKKQGKKGSLLDKINFRKKK